MKKVMKVVAALMLMTAVVCAAGCTKDDPNNGGNNGGGGNGGALNGYQYVDLGLPSGILWATCNVGANTLKEYGDFFAWGETQPKSYYEWSNYKYCNSGGDQIGLTKYCNDSDYGYNGFTDNLTVLEPIDDAATVNWGNGWHTPTMAEWEELNQNTTHVWVTQNNGAGCLYTANNGNSLFIPIKPAYGFGLGYMSSSLHVYSPDEALIMFISDDPWGVEFSHSRCNPWVVRAVHNGNGVGTTQSEVQITTYASQEITSTTALSGGDVVVPQGFAPAELGVCWSTESNPTAEGFHLSTVFWDEPFVCTLTELEPNTQYYVRAYISRGSEYYYGDEKSFTTEGVPSISVLQEEGFVHDGDVVDLNEEVRYGFYMTSNAETGKELKTLVISIDDNEFETIDLTGLTEYTYNDVINFSFGAKEIINVDIMATVTDVGGNSASAILRFSIFIPDQPLETVAFEWVRQGGNSLNEEEMARCGLFWSSNYKDIFATIKPLEGAILYVCDGDDFENITTGIEKANYFAYLSEIAYPVESYRNVSCMYNSNYNDMLAVIDPDGGMHLIHIMRAQVESSNAGLRVSISGELK